MRHLLFLLKKVVTTFRMIIIHTSGGLKLDTFINKQERLTHYIA